jgi:hypothetical protein
VARISEAFGSHWNRGAASPSSSVDATHWNQAGGVEAGNLLARMVTGRTLSAMQYVV